MPARASSMTTALDGLAADDPAHRGIASKPVGVVHVLVPGKAPIDGLTKKTDDAVPAVLTSPAVGQDIGRHCGQPKGIVEFAIGEQPGI